MLDPEIHLCNAECWSSSRWWLWILAIRSSYSKQGVILIWQFESFYFSESTRILLKCLMTHAQNVFLQPLREASLFMFSCHRTSAITICNYRTYSLESHRRCTAVQTQKIGRHANKNSWNRSCNKDRAFLARLTRVIIQLTSLEYHVPAFKWLALSIQWILVDLTSYRSMHAPYALLKGRCQLTLSGTFLFCQLLVCKAELVRYCRQPCQRMELTPIRTNGRAFIM